LAKLDRQDDAAEAWKALIHHNPDYQTYYTGYLTSRGVELGKCATLACCATLTESISGAITDQTRPEAIRILRSFVEQLPRAATPKRLLLNITQSTFLFVSSSIRRLTGIRRGVQ
jgi:N-alpha-acetyltransferase 15/16, NatA auxiliary subunit